MGAMSDIDADMQGLYGNPYIKADETEQLRAEIKRLRGLLHVAMDYFDAIDDFETANKIRFALALGERHL